MRLEKAGTASVNFAQSQFIYLQNLVNLGGPLVALMLLSRAAGTLALAGYALIALVILRFDRRVRDNLTLGAPMAEAAMSEAIRIAGLGKVMASLPQGPDTPVSERGLTLSGGQKQRIALARGILAAAGSSLILLDEPTSSLDTATEAEVFSALCAAFPDATIVTSVHRMHLLARVDSVILMSAGRALDVGSAAELLERQALFRELWQRSGADALSVPEDRPLRAA